MPLLLFVLRPASAWALDKQGSSHGGGGEDTARGFNIQGAYFFGVSPYNPSYAARPDNTGLALFRYGMHLDIDLLGQRLSVPVDLNFFTDAQNPDIAKLQPTEFDIIAGVATTWGLGKGGSLEAGARIEHDRPIDRGERTQTYVDIRAKYLFALAEKWPRLGKGLADGDISGWLTLGGFAWNPTYAARPDNTGKALLRYAAHLELSFWHDHISIGGDSNFFTDREVGGPAVLSPSEVDVTGEIIGRYKNVELHVAWESDLPIDHAGPSQSFLYVLGVWAFDMKKMQAGPLESRGQIISP